MKIGLIYICAIVNEKLCIEHFLTRQALCVIYGDKGWLCMHLTYLYVGKLRRPPDHASATLSPCPKISDVETPRTSSKVLKQWNFSLISLIHTEKTHWRKRQRTAANPTCSLRRICKRVLCNTHYFTLPTNFIVRRENAFCFTMIWNKK